MSTAWKWYGVKTLHRAAASGRPLAKDRDYSRGVSLVEERIVVLKARSFKEAIRKAEFEAKRYSTSCRHRNPYGQRVRSRYLGFYDAYLIDDPPANGSEVYSETEVVPRDVPDRAIITRMIGREESARVYRSRRNVLDIAFQRPATGVRLNKGEEAFIAGLRSRRKRA